MQGFFKGAGQQLLNQAQDVIKQKAADFIKDAIQDVFEKKTVEARVLPSIKSLKVVCTIITVNINIDFNWITFSNLYCKSTHETNNVVTYDFSSVMIIVTVIIKKTLLNVN